MGRKKKREKNGVTNAQLAAWVGVVPSTIQIWRKNNKRPSSEAFKRIGEIVGIQPYILKENFRMGIFIPSLEKSYLAAGKPMAKVSGRDFTDPNRENTPIIKERVGILYGNK